jgi:crotonobetaine/carnitine-CoA ligase
VPDEQSGQEVLAVVLRRSGSSLTERSLLEFLVDELPHFMVPRYLRFMESDFERSASGKVRKDLLRAAGLASGTWDREAAGIRVTRRS